MTKLVFLHMFLIVQLGCFDDIFGQLHYNIYQRDSDEVVGVLGNAGLPMKGTTEYYSVMAARDQRRHQQAFTFEDGDVTTRIENLGSLEYAHIYIGTPSVSFLVALDTGSELFWLPCHCKDSPRSFPMSPEELISLNSYEPGSSSSSEVVPCSSSHCFGNSRESCPLYGPTEQCTYDYSYMSPNTSTKGFLVEDLLYLETYNSNATQRDHIVVPVVFGCGEVERGFVLDAAAINGIIGLAHGTLDLTSQLASRGVVPNSFSMCLTLNGSGGRIAFGDKGDADQMFTPLDKAHRGYNIHIEKISVENVVADIPFVAIFDSGSTITTFSEPTYTMITKFFSVFVKDPRIQVGDAPFDYCYIRESNNTLSWTPSLRLNTKGGGTFHVLSPTITLNYVTPQGKHVYCLGIANNTINTVNIVGRNFMSGYRVVLDREKSILGWKLSDCKVKEANTSNATVLSRMEDILSFFLVCFSLSFTIIL